MPCSLATEQQRYSNGCAREIRHLDTIRTRTRHQRGLAITYVAGTGRYNASGLGLGHTLIVASKLFELCISLRRYCYLHLFDSHLERFFTEPDGTSKATRMSCSAIQIRASSTGARASTSATKT